MRDRILAALVGAVAACLVGMTDELTADRVMVETLYAENVTVTPTGGLRAGDGGAEMVRSSRLMLSHASISFWKGTDILYVLTVDEDGDLVLGDGKGNRVAVWKRDKS